MSKSKEEIKYSKEQVVGSSHFKGTDKDILTVYLEDGKDYSIEEAREVVENFKKGGVK